MEADTSNLWPGSELAVKEIISPADLGYIWKPDQQSPAFFISPTLSIINSGLARRQFDDAQALDFGGMGETKKFRSVISLAKSR